MWLINTIINYLALTASIISIILPILIIGGILKYKFKKAKRDIKCSFKSQ
jgi:hypothetical protein